MRSSTTPRPATRFSDSPTWSGATHKEVQLPLAWSSTSITVQLNRGSFASLAGKYLYVVDADGKVNSQGFAL